MMHSEELQQAIEYYLSVKEKIQQQEDEVTDVMVFGGADEKLYDELHLAEMCVLHYFSPEKYIDLLREKASLESENGILRREAERLGSNLSFLDDKKTKGSRNA